MGQEFESIPFEEKVKPVEGPISTSIRERWDQLMQDEEAKEGLKSIGRLAGNTALAVTEYIPFFGELPDWAAKGAEIAGKVKLTPSVSTKAKLALEGVDTASGTFIPSRTIEGLWQATADYKEGKLEKGIKSIGYLMTGKEDYVKELNENKAVLNKAAEAFK